MTENTVLLGAATQRDSRLDHPLQVLPQITDLLYETADAVSQLRERLVRLADQIEARFAAEERSGRFEDVLCYAPWLTARAQELQQQHVYLVETLRGIQRACESNEGPVAWWQQVQRDFEDFAELFQEHEAAEDNLLRESHPEPSWADD